MPKTQFTTQEIKGYFEGKIKHLFYEDAKDKAEAMLVHSDGEFPEDLITSRRPNEPQEVLEYRKAIFIPKTKPTFNKVVSSLSKIRRANDWSIKYENQEEFSRISEDENLYEYCEVNFPYGFGSVTNWTFAALLKKYLTDPNAIVFVQPIEDVENENQYVKPFPLIFDSEFVLDYVHGDYAVLKNPEGSVYYYRREAYVGESYYFLTTEKIIRFDQIDDKGNMKMVLEVEHGLTILPCFKIGAVICQTEGSEFLYESRISAMAPELDEAIREYSDLQAAKVLHIYPERWEFTQNECVVCKGTGRRSNPNWTVGCDEDDSFPCDNPVCQNGYVVAGPYSKIMIKPADGLTAGQSVPTPPAGFIEKDVEIVKIQEEGVDKHIYNALAAINFEFLMQVPLNQSGTAKEVDKEELNNTVHAIAEDLVRVMDNVYELIALYRYKVQYPVEDIQEKMLPVITVPEKYDIVSSSVLERELSSAKTSKANPEILNALEIEYAGKKFNADPAVRDKLQLTFALDPLPNVTEEEKMSRLTNKGITQRSYVISSNIQEFINRALEEEKDFARKDIKEQREQMKKYADELIKEQDEKTAMVKAVNEDTGLDENGNPIEDDDQNPGQVN
jgi:hypothetical protein